MTEAQPKIVQRMLLRFAIGLFTIAFLLVAWNFLKTYLVDPDLGTINSTGWISAIQNTENGSQAIIIKPDGTLVASPGYVAGKTDQNLVWQPDGERLFFSSDRGEGVSAFHIFRWNPAENIVQQRTQGSRSQVNPTFEIDGSPTPPYNALVMSGGIAVLLDPKTGRTVQQVPLAGNSPTEVAEGNGIGSQFGPEFDLIGKSLRKAQFTADGRYIIAIAERDQGETLMVQDMQPASTSAAEPHPIIAGQHIDFCVDPSSGKVVYAVQGLMLVDPAHPPKEDIQGAKVVLPYQNVVGIFDPNDIGKANGPLGSGIVAAGKTSDTAFGQPAVSPDGSTLVFVEGTFDSSFTPKFLLTCPMKVGGGATVTKLITGEVYSPCWSPDSSKIAFVEQTSGGTQDLFLMNKDSSGLKDLTNGKGNFSDPQISPMMAASAKS